jgi:hypothetical protein
MTVPEERGHDVDLVGAVVKDADADRSWPEV